LALGKAIDERPESNPLNHAGDVYSGTLQFIVGRNVDCPVLIVIH
jgi:hypothetical protein